ncbi:transposable element Tcb2 transposase [Trichonephila clavipes]|nr:transposable element Tcb2 transposase [Trichonephila clavipes]
MNPIEHVWDALGRRVAGRQPPPQTLQELERALLEECNRILQLVIKSLIDSIPQRGSTLLTVLSSCLGNPIINGKSKILADLKVICPTVSSYSGTPHPIPDVRVLKGTTTPASECDPEEDNEEERYNRMSSPYKDTTTEENDDSMCETGPEAFQRCTTTAKEESTTIDE